MAPARGEEFSAGQAFVKRLDELNQKRTARQVARSVRANLIELLPRSYDEQLLPPLPPLPKTQGEEELYLSRKADDRCTYSHLLRHEYTRAQVLEHWRKLRPSSDALMKTANKLTDEVISVFYGVAGVTRQLKRSDLVKEEKDRATRRREEALDLLGPSVLVKATTNVWNKRLYKVGEVFTMNPLEMLDERWRIAFSNALPSRPHFTVVDETRAGKDAKEYCDILDAIGNHRRDTNQKNHERRTAVAVYLRDHARMGEAALARIPEEHRAFCKSIAPDRPPQLLDEPLDISQNKVIRALTKAKTGKVRVRYMKKIRALIGLELLARKGQGRACRLLLGPGPHLRPTPPKR